MADKTSRVLAAIALVVAVGVGVIYGLQASVEPEAPVARSYVCAVYTEQGCAKFVVASGGEIEVQSGGTLDIQSGATSGFGGNLAITGTLDVDGATTLNSTLDVDGNISSGTGVVTVTDSVEITGAVDCDSTFNADGAVTLNSTVDIDGNISSGTGAISVTDNVDITGTLNYGTGDLTPLAYDSTTQYEVYVGNASSVTQTTVTSATHNMTTAVDWGICFVSDPDADAGDPAYCTISISGTSITFQALDDDGDNASTAATAIYYLIVGR